MFTVATPVSGPLEVHAAGCGHMSRLHAEGGGILVDGIETIGRARDIALQDADNVRTMPCAKKEAR